MTVEEEKKILLEFIREHNLCEEASDKAVLKAIDYCLVNDKRGSLLDFIFYTTDDVYDWVEYLFDCYDADEKPIERGDWSIW